MPECRSEDDDGLITFWGFDLLSHEHGVLPGYPISQPFFRFTGSLHSTRKECFLIVASNPVWGMGIHINIQ